LTVDVRPEVCQTSSQRAVSSIASQHSGSQNHNATAGLQQVGGPEQFRSNRAEFIVVLCLAGSLDAAFPTPQTPNRTVLAKSWYPACRPFLNHGLFPFTTPPPRPWNRRSSGPWYPRVHPSWALSPPCRSFVSIRTQCCPQSAAGQHPPSASWGQACRRSGS